MSQHGLGSLDDLARADDRAVNAVLAARLQDLAARHEALYKGGDLLSAVMNKFPWLRGKLAEAWHSYSVWRHAVPHATRLGLDYTVLLALLSVCLLWNWPIMAACLAGGFHGLLRPAEIACLKRAHIRLPCDGVGWSGKPRAVVCIVKPKTRTRAAMTQSVLIEDERALEVLRVCLHGVGLNCLLLPGGSMQLRNQLGHLLNALAIGHLAYGPSSLRPGGALHLYTVRGCSLADLMYRGRWDCPRTLSHYLQEGFAALALTYVGESAARRIRELAQLLPELLAEKAEKSGLAALDTLAGERRDTSAWSRVRAGS
jgi:hypothetical protein